MAPFPHPCKWSNYQIETGCALEPSQLFNHHNLLNPNLWTLGGGQMAWEEAQTSGLPEALPQIHGGFGGSQEHLAMLGVKEARLSILSSP